jgi:hypothetical protein
VSLNDAVGVTTLGRKGPHRRQGSLGWTAVDVLGRIDERADGTGGSADAVTGAAIGPCRESQVISMCLWDETLGLVTGPHEWRGGNMQSMIRQVLLLALNLLALAGCTLELEQRWYKLGGNDTVADFQRDQAECTAAVNVHCP